MVNAQLEQIAQAGPGKQRDVMTNQKSVIVHQYENIRDASSEAHELCPSFAMDEDVSFQRHKSILEKRSTEKTSKHHVPRPGQSNFTSIRKDYSQHVSKALKGGRTAMQGAEHVQACINASQRAAKQPPPQPQQQQQRRTYKCHWPCNISCCCSSSSSTCINSNTSFTSSKSIKTVSHDQTAQDLSAA
jgi:hypothetical protein